MNGRAAPYAACETGRAQRVLLRGHGACSDRAMANTYLPEWPLELQPSEKKPDNLLYWSQELGVSRQELRSALMSTSIDAMDTPVVSERRQQAERRRDGRRRHE